LASASALAFFAAFALAFALFLLAHGTKGWWGQCFSPQILHVGTNLSS